MRAKAVLTGNMSFSLCHAYIDDGKRILEPAHPFCQALHDADEHARLAGAGWYQRRPKPTSGWRRVLVRGFAPLLPTDAERVADTDLPRVLRGPDALTRPDTKLAAYTRESRDRIATSCCYASRPELIDAPLEAASVTHSRPKATRSGSGGRQS